MEIALKHMKRCLTWLLIREVYVKTIQRYNFSQIRLTKTLKLDSSDYRLQGPLGMSTPTLLEGTQNSTMPAEGK